MTQQKIETNKIKTFSKTCVILLPSEANKVILQYDPTLRISVVTSAKTRTVSASRSPTSNAEYWEEKFDLKVPTTILSGVFSYPKSGNGIDFSGMQSQNYSIWAVDDTKKDGIYAAPYEVGNIHPGGNICFGSVAPKTLRHAHNLFWSIPFTDHMWARRHEVNYCNNCPSNKRFHQYNGTHGRYHIFDNHAPKHNCFCSKDIFHQHLCLDFRVGVVKDASKRTSLIKSILKKKPEEQEKLILGLPAKCAQCRCCESLIKNQTLCTCAPRHKTTCGCSNNWNNRCTCPCDCNCCSKKCDCKCQCYCCAGTCRCPCSCYKDKFVKHLKSYDFSKNLKWSNMTIAICGDRYFAKPTTASGLLISSSPDIMVEIPKKYWKEYTISTRDKSNYAKINKTNHSFVVGLGNQNSDGETWDFEVGDTKFTLPENKLVFK